MPFKSKQQMKWMFANHPEMAKRWAEHTTDMKKLPKKVKKAAYAFVDTHLMEEIIKQAAQQAASNLTPQPTGLAKQPPVAPNFSSQNQYGLNSQNAVRETAKQLQVPKKASFLQKLAEGPPTQASPPVAVPLPPGAVAAPAAAPKAPVEKDEYGYVLPAKPQGSTPTVVPPLDLSPGKEPAAPLKPLGGSSWARALTTGEGSSAIPSHLASRVHAKTPEDLKAITPIWNLRQFAPHLAGKLEDPTAAVSSQDVADMHRYHQQRFMEYVNEVAPEHAKSFQGASPHVFDIMSGAGTPAQRFAGEKYLDSLEQAKGRIERRNEYAKDVRSEGATLDKKIQAAKDNDKIFKDWTGTNIAEIADLEGLNPQNKDRGWGEWAGQGLGTAGNIAMSPAGMLIPLPAAGGLAGGALRYFMRPSQYGNTAGALAGLAGANDYQKDYLNKAVNAGTQLGYGLSALGSLPAAASQAASGATLGRRAMGLANMASNALYGYDSTADAYNLYKNGPTLAELRQGRPEPSASDFMEKYKAEQDVLQPDRFDSSNRLPDVKDWQEKLKDTPSYMASGKFNLGVISQHPEVQTIDEQVKALDGLPADRRTVESQRLDGLIAKHFGSNLNDYKNYSTSTMAVNAARKDYQNIVEAYDSALQRRDGSQSMEDVLTKLQSDVKVKQSALIKAQQQAAPASTPFLTTALNKRYEVEIKPMEGRIGELVPKIEAIRTKLMSNQPLTDEDSAVVQQGKEFMDISKDYANEKMRLEFMKNGNLATPGIDQIFAQPSQQSFKTLSELFSGKNEPVYGADGQPIMMHIAGADGRVTEVPLTKNSNVLLTATRQKMDEQIYQATSGQARGSDLGYNNPPPAGGGPRGIDGRGAPGAEEPSMFNQIKEMIWDDMPDWGKMLMFGGLALGTISMLGSMFGGNDDDEEGGSSWMPLLGMLGIGAAVGLPLAKALGFGDMLGLSAGAEKEPAIGQAPQQAQWGGTPVKPGQNPAAATKPTAAPFAMDKITQTGRQNPQEAARMIAHNAALDPKLRTQLSNLNTALNSNSDLSNAMISLASSGSISADQAAMLKAHWPLIKKEMGFN